MTTFSVRPPGCPDEWVRVGHHCYKKFTDAGVDNALKAHALCTRNNAELFTPISAHAYRLVMQLLV